MKDEWPMHPLSEFVTSRPGNNKIIKGKQSDQPGDGLVQAFSASGPDVWVTTADYNQPGVVISAVGARCGKTFMADGEWTAIANTHVLIPGKGIDPRWLWYRTNEETFWIRGGTAQPFVKVKDTLQQPCKIPPLGEQQRIVGILDEAFEGIGTAKANAEKNLQNARALFESHLQSVFTQRGEGWVEKTLEDLGTITSSKRIFKSEYVPTGVPFYRTKEIKELANGREITTELFISEARYNEIKTCSGVPKEGDILLTAIGTIGEIWVVEGDNDFYFKDGNVLWLKEFSSINPNFLKYVLLSFVERLNKMAHGAAYSALPIQRLNAHRIFLPSPSEQEGIAVTLDSLREETERLATIYERKIASLDELKKSLLHQAFTGNL